MGGVEMVAAAVRADLAARLPSQNKKQREGLALLVATALDVRSVNLMELAAAVPRAAERLDMRYQWISRLLGNVHIDVEAVMAPYAREVLARACAGSRALGVIIDQSKVNDAHHMVMVSLRVGERALPLAWRWKKTQGATVPTVCAGAWRRCLRTSRPGGSVSRPGRSSARIGLTGSAWSSRWRSIGRFHPECGTPWKTGPPPKKSRGGAAQECRP